MADLLTGEALAELQMRQAARKELLATGHSFDPQTAMWDAGKLLAHVAAMQAENRELKIIIDVGTGDDPGTALSKLHKIQHQAVESFRQRAVAAVRAEWINFRQPVSPDTIVKLLQQLPATTTEGGDEP